VRLQRTPGTPHRAITAGAIEYAGLAALVIAAFLAIVVAGGDVLRLDVPHPGLTLAAASVLGLTFEPARGLLRRLANRLVYRQRISPLEAVNQLAAQMGHTHDVVDLLRELSSVVRAGTGARDVQVWLRLDTIWDPVAGSPDMGIGERVAVTDDKLPRLPGADLTIPIRHGGELLGAITVAKSGPSSLMPLERRLVTDLASHAGVVTRTLHLRETLQRRLDVSRRQQLELVASRAQVVAAQDSERRRLALDIHDTCQQRAVVLAGRLGLVQTLVRSDPHEAHAVLEAARADVGSLAMSLRRLAAAAPLPALVADGIAAALRTETATLPLAVEVDDGTGRRYRPALEAAVYFCCMEAVQNAVKHADASSIRVELAELGGLLTVTVRDDGAGFDAEYPKPGTGLASMRERLLAWAGRVAVRSSPAGTTVELQVPSEAAQ
jgi:signal transduction histidine kinase